MYSSWPCSEIIQRARCGFYLWRNWHTWEQHNEVLMVWQDVDGQCHIRCYASMGERAEILKDSIVDADFVLGFLDIVQQVGIMDLPSQLIPRSSAHGDDYVAIKTADASMNSYIVKAMRHNDSRHEAIVLLSYAISPELVKYYGLSRRGLRKRLHEMFDDSGISISSFLH